MLFLTMINDLGIMGLPAEMWKFADDTTVSEITDWTNLNRFQLNPTKCK